MPRLPKKPAKKPAKQRDQQGRTRDRTKWTDDRYVPISPQWLRAVMREQGVTGSELARQSGVSQQNIDAILSSDESRTTRRSRRAALAEVLGIAEELLAGVAAFMPRGKQLGYEYGYSARTGFAAQRLLTRCDIAARRDVERSTASEDSGNLAREYLQDMIGDLMQVGSWRERLLRWTPPRHPRQGYREPLSEDITDPLGGAPVDDPRHEEGTVALIRALEHVLTPWFEDQAALDYAAIQEFTTLQPSHHTQARERPISIIPPDLAGTAERVT